ncbi:transglutaminase domain-containing protein [Hungatella hathewayi]|uniref:Transglutaminase domain-containing protein n=1 Tax=Hungatella hathewayi TaxID=154046 RepID=A0A174BUT5_9FIRM|nr:transglutaminase domain-containing protein [Hungatella hathewayi]
MKGYNEVDRYIQETNMLDYSDIHIQKLIQNRGWLELSDFDRIKAIYNYVRDGILFGYNLYKVKVSIRILEYMTAWMIC